MRTSLNAVAGSHSITWRSLGEYFLPKDGNSTWKSSGWIDKKTLVWFLGAGNYYYSCHWVLSNSLCFSAVDVLVIFHWSRINSPIISDRLKNLPGHLLVLTISLHLIVQVLLTPLQRQADQLKKVLKLRNSGRSRLQTLFCCGQKNSVHCKSHSRLINSMLHLYLLHSSECGDIFPCFFNIA